MRYARILPTLPAIGIAVVAVTWSGEASATCYLCSSDNAEPTSNCYTSEYNWYRHKRGGVAQDSTLGYRISHSSENWWCNNCGAPHNQCESGEDPPIGGGEEEVFALFDSEEPAKLVTAVRELGDDAFVERSTGRLVVVNCRGEIAQQFKLTSDQIAALSAATEQVGAAE